MTTTEMNVDQPVVSTMANGYAIGIVKSPSSYKIHGQPQSEPQSLQAQVQHIGYESTITNANMSISELCNTNKCPQSSPSSPADIPSLLRREEEAALFLAEMKSISPVTTPGCTNGGLLNLDNNNLSDIVGGTGTSGFISRVTQLPVVNSTIRHISDVYSTSKNNNPVIKYSAETMERLFDTTRPVLSKLTNPIDQLDQFACRQLDRLEKGYETYLGQTQMARPEQQFTTQSAPLGVDGQHFQQHQVESMRNKQLQVGPQHSSVQMGENGSLVSRWNSYLSVESRRTLYFCLEWLQYAITHIESQIQILRAAMTPTSQSSSPLNSLFSLCQSVKREVITTLRKVVDILSKYAGGSLLSWDARNLVRGFILSLPMRVGWGSHESTSNPTSNALASSMNSGAGGPGIFNPNASGNGQTQGTVEYEAGRVLKLAEESNSALRSTMAVFGQTVSTAENLLQSCSTSSTGSTGNMDMER